MTGQRKLPSRVPRSCIRNQSQENLLKRTKIVLAVPSYNRQRLSGIRRGWCPSQIPEKRREGFERVVRSDSGVAHRLSLSARVVSAVDSQVKAKRQGRKRLSRLRIRHAPREFGRVIESGLLRTASQSTSIFTRILWKRSRPACLATQTLKLKAYLSLPRKEPGFRAHSSSSSSSSSSSA